MKQTHILNPASGGGSIKVCIGTDLSEQGSALSILISGVTRSFPTALGIRMLSLLLRACNIEEHGPLLTLPPRAVCFQHVLSLFPALQPERTQDGAAPCAQQAGH